MSLAEFHRALADLAASPRRLLAARADPEAALGGLDLTPRERRRLAAAAGQEGMGVHCSLYRMNRLTPLSLLAPCTLHVLGECLRRTLEAFWDTAPTRRDFRAEVTGFWDFLRDPDPDPLLAAAMAVDRVLLDVNLPGGERAGDAVLLYRLPFDPRPLLEDVAREVPARPVVPGEHWVAPVARGEVIVVDADGLADLRAAGLLRDRAG